jgi:hypothetical protein
MTKFENFHWKLIIVTFALTEQDLYFLQRSFRGCFIWMLVSYPSIGLPNIYDIALSKYNVLVSCAPRRSAVQVDPFEVANFETGISLYWFKS